MNESVRLFSQYMRLCGVPTTAAEKGPIPALNGKRLGIINGSAWVQLWSYYFGRKYLPGVKLVNAGNEAVQLNFMRAHENGEPCPPADNIEAFVRYALDLIRLYRVDAILLTCSTMNRAYRTVETVAAAYHVPVIQIDKPMMENSIRYGGKTLIIATHGPTVQSTQALLRETAKSMRTASPEFIGATLENAFDILGQGDIEGHNRLLTDCILEYKKKYAIDQVVLAQLSMSVLGIEYPNLKDTFGIPVFTSGIEGFLAVRKLLEKKG